MQSQEVPASEHRSKKELSIRQTLAMSGPGEFSSVRVSMTTDGTPNFDVSALKFKHWDRDSWLASALVRRGSAPPRVRHDSVADFVVVPIPHQSICESAIALSLKAPTEV